eukprot:765767-Hanusia_phi.AAC.16
MLAILRGLGVGAPVVFLLLLRFGLKLRPPNFEGKVEVRSNVGWRVLLVGSCYKGGVQEGDKGEQISSARPYAHPTPVSLVLPTRTFPIMYPILKGPLPHPFNCTTATDRSKGCLGRRSR